MDYFPAITQYKLQATWNGGNTVSDGETPSTVAIGIFTDRSFAENRVKRLSTVHAFDSYILIEESVRTLIYNAAVLSTTNYDMHGEVVASGAKGRRGSAPR